MCLRQAVEHQLDQKDGRLSGVWAAVDRAWIRSTARRYVYVKFHVWGAAGNGGVDCNCVHIRTPFLIRLGEN